MAKEPDDDDPVSLLEDIKNEVFLHKIDSNVKFNSNSSFECPVCEQVIVDQVLKDFRFKSAEVHVNICLDKNNDDPTKNRTDEDNQQPAKGIVEKAVSTTMSYGQIIFNRVQMLTRNLKLKIDERKDIWSSKRKQPVAGGYKRYQCPPFKIMPKTNISVDAFMYGKLTGIENYFLT